MTDISTGNETLSTVEIEPKFAPKCIWCNAPWSDENVNLEIEGASYCETCGDSGYPALTITCHACKRLMYEKSGYW